MRNHSDVPFHEDYMAGKHGVEDRKTQISRTDLGSAFLITGQCSEMLNAARQAEFKPFKTLLRASLRPPWMCVGDCCVCLCVLSVCRCFSCDWMRLSRRSTGAHESAGSQGFETFSASEAETQPTVLSVRLLIAINHANVGRRRCKRR